MITTQRIGPELIRHRLLVSRFAIFAALDDDVVEAFWIVIDTDR